MNIDQLPRTVLPTYNISNIETTEYSKTGLAGIVSTDKDGPYQVAEESIWSASTRFNNLNYKYTWKADEVCDVKFVSIPVKNKMIPLTTIDGKLTVFTGQKEGTFETWDYWGFSVCADPPTKIRVSIEVIPYSDTYTGELPYIDYLEFEYKDERYKFPVSKTEYGPNDDLFTLVIVNSKLIETQKKILQTLYILGCKLPSAKNNLLQEDWVTVSFTFSTKVMITNTSFGGGRILFTVISDKITDSNPSRPRSPRYLQD